MDGQYKGRAERQECGHQSCSVGDSGQTEVETDRTTLSSANSTNEKQEAGRNIDIHRPSPIFSPEWEGRRNASRLMNEMIDVGTIM